MNGFFTTKQVAEMLGVSSARIRQMIIEGVIKAEKVGRDNFIAEDEVARVKGLNRKAGRPTKTIASE